MLRDGLVPKYTLKVLPNNTHRIRFAPEYSVDVVNTVIAGLLSGPNYALANITIGFNNVPEQRLPTLSTEIRFCDYVKSGRDNLIAKLVPFSKAYKATFQFNPISPEPQFAGKITEQPILDCFCEFEDILGQHSLQIGLYPSYSRPGILKCVSDNIYDCKELMGQKTLCYVDKVADKNKLLHSLQSIPIEKWCAEFDYKNTFVSPKNVDEQVKILLAKMSQRFKAFSTFSTLINSDFERKYEERL